MILAQTRQSSSRSGRKRLNLRKIFLEWNIWRVCWWIGYEGRRGFSKSPTVLQGTLMDQAATDGTEKTWRTTGRIKAW